MSFFSFGGGIVASVTAVATATALTAIFGDAPQSEAATDQEQEGDEKIRYVHAPTPSKRPTRRNSVAQTQATAHWPTTMAKAHLPPSSRLTEAIAATQGV